MINGDLVHNQLEIVAKAIERIALTQEKLLAIAEASQKERNELSDKMKQAFKIEGVKHETK